MQQQRSFFAMNQEQMWDLLFKPDTPDNELALANDWAQDHYQSVQDMYGTIFYNLDKNPKAAYQQLRRIKMSGIDTTPLLETSIHTFKSVQLVLYVWHHMLRKSIATLGHANMILSLTSSWRLKNTALRVLKEMKTHGIDPDSESHALIISTIGRERLNNHEEALAYFHELMDDGFAPNARVYMSMMTACKTRESIGVAKNVLELYLQDEGVDKIIQPFNAIIGLTAKNDQMDFAIRMLRNLDSFGVYPSATTFFIILSTIQQDYLHDSELLLEAEQLFYFMVESEVPPIPGSLHAAMDIGKHLESPVLVESARELMEMAQHVQDDYDKQDD